MRRGHAYNYTGRLESCIAEGVQRRTGTNYSLTHAVRYGSNMPLCIVALLQVPNGEEHETIKEGVVMFLSFAIFGAMPLMG